MKHIKIVLLALIAVGMASSCKPEEVLYDGPNIAYFDNKGVTRAEIVEETKVVSFTIVSPLKTNFDREYDVVRKFGSTLDEGEYTIETKRVTIKAGEFSAIGRVSFNPEVLTPKADTLALGLTALNGQIANFDNTMKLVVSQRCLFVPALFVGEYDFYSAMFGLSTIRKVEAVPGEDNALLVKQMYGTPGADVKIVFDESDPTVVRPVIEMQYAGQIKVIDQYGKQIDTDFMVCSSDQYSYPKLPATPNTSTFVACAGELKLKVTFGVFVDNEDGTQSESHLYGSPSNDILTKLTAPYSARTSFLKADNIECRGIVTAE